MRVCVVEDGENEELDEGEVEDEDDGAQNGELGESNGACS